MKYLLLLIFFSSCSGYKVKRNDNPLSHYKIRSISIPQFVNYSSIPNVGTILTRQMFNMFTQFAHLKIYRGENKKTDATLVGIVESQNKEREVFLSKDNKFINRDGTARKFYLPTENKYALSVRLVLVRNSDLKNRKILRSKLGKFVQEKGNVIFNRILVLEGSYSLSLSNSQNIDGAGVTNFTKSNTSFVTSLEESSEAFVNNFRETVINVF